MPVEERCGELCRGLLESADADWAVATRHGEVVLQLGQPPELAWVVAFLDGSEHLDAARPANGPGDIMWARLRRAGIAIAAGRAARPVHARERQRVALLAQIVDGLLG